MKKYFSIVKRYKVFLILFIINSCFYFYSPTLGKASFTISYHNLLEMVSIIPPIFLLLGLLDVWIPKETMMKYMGKDAGIKGGIIAFILGSFSAGPLYAAFPVVGVFLKKGVSLTNIFIFVGSWSTTKIPMMLFEITQLGITFALIRFLLNVIGIIMIAIIMDKTTSKEEGMKIQEKNFS